VAKAIRANAARPRVGAAKAEAVGKSDLSLRVKAILESEPHAARTTETLVVLSGALRLRVGSSSYELGSGDSAFFRADVAHA